MRLFIGVSLLALIGCGSDDADGVFVDASWTVRNVSMNSPLGCPDGFSRVMLSAKRTDGGRCHETMVECTKYLDCDVLPAEGETRTVTGTGTSDRLEPGQYEVQLSIVNEDPPQTYAIALPERLDLTLGDKPHARQFFTDGGVFQFGWRLLSGTTPRSCGQAGVSRVAIIVVNEADTSTSTSDEVTCEDGGIGYSFAFGNGSYTVSLEAVNGDGQTLGTSSLEPPISGQKIMGPNGITDLGVVDVNL